MSDSINPSRRDFLVLLASGTALSLVPKRLVAGTFPAERQDATAISHAAARLIQRVIPEYAHHFVSEVIAPENGHDVFEIEGGGNKVILRGNNAVSIASALNFYLKHFCCREFTWSDKTINSLPSPLPAVPAKVRRATPFRYRQYFNCCTFSYTAAWWNWERWEHEIDWMAMHGVNMPLAITGQEAVWQRMLRRFRMSDDEIRAFLCGPAFFAWQWMANLEGWGGPLPQSWIDSHRKLGQQILNRERELGMTPILQGFTGFVPRAIKDKYPDARIQLKPHWCNVFRGTAQLDPLHLLFRSMGTAFLESQQQLFGTDHLYAADPFHESEPPDDAPDYLPSVAKEILDTMKAVDPKATIVMQTWSLRKPIATNIPGDHIVLLAMNEGQWETTDGFWDRPWVSGVIHNFGGRVFMAGSVHKVLTDPFLLRANHKAGHIAGIGLLPEGIEQNPVFYEAATEVTWMQEPPDAASWLQAELAARYRKRSLEAEEAWSILLRSLYSDGSEEGSLESPICSRPALTLVKAAPDANFQRHYDPGLVWDAWKTLQAAARALQGEDKYEYDLVNLARQGLADLSIPLQRDITAAYLAGDNAQLKEASARFLDLAMDMDCLLATRSEFLLGRWLEDAKKWGTTEAERKQYERNARLQITVWGPSAPDAFLFDYANKQWSGLIRGYYIPRWRLFLDYLASQPSGEGRFTDKDLPVQYERPTNGANEFYRKLSRWEQAWCDQTELYTTQTRGQGIPIAAELFTKWNGVRLSAYRRYDLRSPA